MKNVLLIAGLVLVSSSVMASGSSKKPAPETQRQSQGQHQKQSQSQNAKANSDSYSDAYSDAYSDSYSESQAVSNGGDVTVSDNSSSTSTYNEKRRPVNTAYAAPLVAGDDTCMGSTSAGGMGITLGFSFATTWKDNDCVVRKDARFLQNAQRQDIALSLMCSKPSVLAAVKRAGSRAEKIACGLPVETIIVPAPKKPQLFLGVGERG